MLFSRPAIMDQQSNACKADEFRNYEKPEPSFRRRVIIGKACNRAFKQAIANAKGLLPNKVHTDSLNSYNHAIKATLPNVEHVANCGIKKRHANNNRIERLNGTIRERVKVQRGWKIVQTPLAEGQRIQYNFVKPHMALDGKTPANAAGLKVKGWKELLKLTIDSHR